MENQFDSLADYVKFSKEEKAKNSETIDLTAPSGFVFKFTKFSELDFLLSFDLPKDTDTPDVKSSKNSVNFFAARKIILEYSHAPKIVFDSPEENEISIQDIDNKDLGFIFNWVISGGQITSPKKS